MRRPFIMSNTNRSEKKAMHRWSILDLHPQKQFFFVNFGFEGFKIFIFKEIKQLLMKYYLKFIIFQKGQYY